MSCGGCKDELALAHESPSVALLGLRLDVGHFVPDAALMTLVGKQSLQRYLEARVPIRGEELEVLPLETTVFQVDQELGPVCFRLGIHQME